MQYIGFIERYSVQKPVIISSTISTCSRGVTVTRVLASNQCGMGLILFIAMCGLSFLLVQLALRLFLEVFLVFQFDHNRSPAKTDVD